MWREEGGGVGKDGEGKEAEMRGEGVKERMHLLREVGCVLLLAQRRAREGCVEEKRGEGMWWAEKRRWGGGRGVAVFKEGENDGSVGSGGGCKKAEEGFQVGERVGMEGEGSVSASGSASGQGDAGVKDGGSLIEAQRRRVKRLRRNQAPESRRASTAAVVPPRSLWERNVKYVRIGKEVGGGWDDVSWLLFTSPLCPFTLSLCYSWSRSLALS